MFIQENASEYIAAKYVIFCSGINVLIRKWVSVAAELNLSMPFWFWS